MTAGLRCIVRQLTNGQYKTVEQIFAMGTVARFIVVEWSLNQHYFIILMGYADFGVNFVLFIIWKLCSVCGLWTLCTYALNLVHCFLHITQILYFCVLLVFLFEFFNSLILGLVSYFLSSGSTLFWSSQRWMTAMFTVQWLNQISLSFIYYQWLFSFIFQVSKSWRSLAEDELLWCRICHRLGFEKDTLTVEHSNWKSRVRHYSIVKQTLELNWKVGQI